MSRSRSISRHCAVKALYQWQLSSSNIHDIDLAYIAGNNINKVDLAYYHELLHQIVTSIDEIDACISTKLDRPVAEVDPVELAILRIGTYELGNRKDIPFRVVINEAVELAKSFGSEGGHKYVNSILDKLAPILRPEETIKNDKKARARLK